MLGHSRGQSRPIFGKVLRHSGPIFLSSIDTRRTDLNINPIATEQMNTKPKMKTLTAIAIAAALGGTALAGAGYASHRDGDHGIGFSMKGSLAVSAMEMFDAIDTDADGRLTQAEIDRFRNDRHDAHDANGDGNLGIEEFAGLWHETTRPLTVRAFQMLDTDGDAVVTRAEYDRPLAGIVERLDRDGGLSMRDRWYVDDDDGRWRDDD